jgi:hypothetical protein
LRQEEPEMQTVGYTSVLPILALIFLAGALSAPTSPSNLRNRLSPDPRIDIACIHTCGLMAVWLGKRLRVMSEAPVAGAQWERSGIWMDD